MHDYRTIYTLLVLIVATIGLVDLAAHKSIIARVNGLQASVADARDAMSDLSGTGTLRARESRLSGATAGSDGSQFTPPDV